MMKKWITALLILISLQAFAPPLEKNHYELVKKFNHIQFLVSLPDKIFEISGVRVPDNVKLEDLELMYLRADSLNIPKRILFRLIYQESRYNPYAISPVGAFSYMQIMPNTFASYKKKFEYGGYHSPQFNIMVGTQMISDLASYWSEKCKSEERMWRMVLASYNAGKGWVLYYNGVPPFKETKGFVKFILS